MELPSLEKLKIDRCVKPPGLDTVTSRQLHIFSDASNFGYGSVAYLRLVNTTVVFIALSSWVKPVLAPIKAITISRMELTAATVAIRVGSLLSKELTFPHMCVYHADSTTVLLYIVNKQQRFHVIRL